MEAEAEDLDTGTIEAFKVTAIMLRPNTQIATYFETIGRDPDCGRDFVA